MFILGAIILVILPGLLIVAGVNEGRFPFVSSLVMLAIILTVLGLKRMWKVQDMEYVRGSKPGEVLHWIGLHYLENKEVLQELNEQALVEWKLYRANKSVYGPYIDDYLGILQDEVAKLRKHETFKEVEQYFLDNNYFVGAFHELVPAGLKRNEKVFKTVWWYYWEELEKKVTTLVPADASRDALGERASAELREEMDAMTLQLKRKIEKARRKMKGKVERLIDTRDAALETIAMIEQSDLPHADKDDLIADIKDFYKKETGRDLDYDRR